LNNDKNNSSSFNDLLSSGLLAIFAIVVMLFSLDLEVPGSIYTAPGLLPFVISLILFVLSFILVSIHLKKKIIFNFNRDTFSVFLNDQNRRTLFLLLLISIYIFLVGLVNFELVIPIFTFEYRLSSFQIISTVMTTIIVKNFWQKKTLTCLVVVFLFIEILSAIFRYGFGILMPGSF